MARPGQALSRRKRTLDHFENTSSIGGDWRAGDADGFEDDDEAGYSGNGGGNGKGDKVNPRAQCLPIGDLPENFDGIPLDGAQFLAMAVKSNDQLPSYKSVPNPYRRAYTPSTPVDIAPQASTSRHPALPKGSWEVLFPLHFVGYRKHLAATWPSTPNQPYPSHYPPLPTSSRRSDWFMYINGYQLPLRTSTESKGKKKAKVVIDEEEAMNAEIPSATKDQEEEGEEEASEVQAGLTESKSNKKGAGLVRGQPREPLVGVIQRLNSTQAVQILSHFAYWLDETITQLPSPVPLDPSDLLPTQPSVTNLDDIDPADQAASSAAAAPADRAPVPLSSNYLAWIFSLLLIVDRQLSSEQISTLRELARSAMRVAGWRWIRAVVSREVGENWNLGKKAQMSGEKIGVVEGTSSSVEKEMEKSKDEKEEDEDDVDDTLARCWIIVHAVAAGWGQTDLLSDLENLFT